jgi:hypothetical protein
MNNILYICDIKAVMCTYVFASFYVEVLIIRYDKMLSHMTPHVHLSD